MLPKLKLDGATVSPAWVPVPLKLMVKEELDASLTIFTDPVVPPAAVGV